MKNYVQKGDHLTVPAPADVLSGELVFVGSIFGVASFDALSGAPVVLSTGGVYDLPKVSAQAVTIGAPLYWDAGDSLVTTDDDEGANVQIGVAIKAAANPSPLATVRLNPSF